MSTESELTLSPSKEKEVAVEATQFTHFTQNQLAWQDIKAGFANWRIWLMLAYQDIKLRYRRSILGPFWLTMSMAITVYSMGYLYAHLFHVELQRYYPLLVSGMLSWSLISCLIIDYTEGFVAFDRLIKQIHLPYTLHIHRLAARNVLIFSHNLLVIIPILIIFHEYAKVNFYTLLLVPGLLAIYLNAMSFGLIIAMLGARYRDVSQIIKSLVQVIFFVTPVMWGPEIIGEKNQFIVNYNPFYALLEMIRQPLLGHPPTLRNVITVLIITLIGGLISFHLFAGRRARIVYWL